MEDLNHFGEFFLANYRIGHQVGRGSFAKVFSAEHVTTGHKVAIKVLNRQKIHELGLDEKVAREIKVLQFFMHPHVIRLYEVIQTPAYFYLVMEFAEMGELFDLIQLYGRLLEEEARRFFQQILSGVEYCHRHSVVHRDLKPENLLLDENRNVKIADFGLSNIMQDGHFLSTRCGSLNYAAPEVLVGQLYAGPELDVWSCGVILYAMLCGQLPFDDKDIPTLFHKIRNGIYTMPAHISPSATDLLRRMLLVNPVERLTVPEIRQHAWFRQQLPRYIELMQADVDLDSSWAIDPDALEGTVALGYERQQLYRALHGKEHNAGVVAYSLLRDCKRRATIWAELAAAARLGIEPLRLAPGPVPAAVPQSSAALRMAGDVQPWRLGALLSCRDVQQVMELLCRAFKALNISWKRLTPYSLRCRTAVAPVHRPPQEAGGWPHSEDGAHYMVAAAGSPPWGSTDSLMRRLAEDSGGYTDGSGSASATHMSHMLEQHTGEGAQLQPHFATADFAMGDAPEAFQQTPPSRCSVGQLSPEGLTMDAWGGGGGAEMPPAAETGPRSSSSASSNCGLHRTNSGRRPLARGEDDGAHGHPRKLINLGRGSERSLVDMAAGPLSRGGPHGTPPAAAAEGGGGGSMAAAAAAARLTGGARRDVAGPQLLQRVVKFEVQVFVVDDTQHAIDLQCVEGDVLIFMDICAQLMPLLGM